MIEWVVSLRLDSSRFHYLIITPPSLFLHYAYFIIGASFSEAHQHLLQRGSSMPLSMSSYCSCSLTNQLTCSWYPFSSLIHGFYSKQLKVFERVSIYCSSSSSKNRFRTSQTLKLPIVEKISMENIKDIDNNLYYMEVNSKIKFCIWS